MFKSVKVLQDQVKSDSIDFDKAVFHSLKFDIEQEDNVREGKFIVLFSEGESNYEIRIKHCFYTGKRWAFLDNLKLLKR